MKDQNVKKLLDEITEIIDYSFSDLQSWESMTDWPIDETRKIGSSLNTKVCEDEHEMRFLTYLPAGEHFPKHWHDVAETCRVLSGILEDAYTGRRWERDEIAIFSRGQKHIPANPSKELGTWLEVRFQK